MGFIKKGMSKTGKVESILNVKPGLTKYASGSAATSFTVKKTLLSEIATKKDDKG